MSENQKRKVDELIARGYKIYDQNHWEVRLIKGYSYCVVDRSGNRYVE